MKPVKIIAPKNSYILSALDLLVIFNVILVGIAASVSLFWNEFKFQVANNELCRLDVPTASLLILSSAGLLLLLAKKPQPYTSQAGKIASALVVLIAFTSLILYFVQVKLSPGLALEPNSAFAFLITGSSLYFLADRRMLISQSLSFLVSLILLLSLVGYSQRNPMYDLPFSGSATPAAAVICLVLLSMSALLLGRKINSQQEESPVQQPGSVIKRWWLPALSLIPFLALAVHIHTSASSASGPRELLLMFCILFTIVFFVTLSIVQRTNLLDSTLKAEIEERAKVDSEVEDNNRFLEIILDNIPYMIFVKKGKELRYAAINKAGEQILGIPRQEYIGKVDEDFFPDEQAAFFREKDFAVFNSGDAIQIEEEPITTRHGERWLRTQKIPVKDENGSPLYIVGLSEDVTHKRRQEQKIKQFYAELEQKVKERTQDLSNSEKRFRALIENSTDGITITDAEFKIIYESPGVERMIGFSSAERSGQLLFNSIQSQDIVRGEQLLNDLLANPGKAITMDFRLTHQDGSSVWVEGTATNLLNDESVRAVIFNYRDITDRKQHELERERLIQELIRHNNNLKQFSYITSHNLRAPLSNLLGLLGLLKYTKVEDPALQEILNGFDVSAHSLNDTINDLLNILYIKETTTVETEAVAVGTLLEKVLSQVANQIEEVKPRLFIDIPENSTIHFNRAYLESILLNLLTNAIKYRAEDRQLELHIALWEEEEQTVLSFGDNGIGLDLERNGKKVFGLYQRFHNRPDSKGLGLHLVKTQVEALGGTIEIKSAVDKGTTFILKFNKLYVE